MVPSRDPGVLWNKNRVRPRWVARPGDARTLEPYLEPMENLLLDLHDVTKEFIHGEDTLLILKSISLQVAAGERVAIVGASGAGKSTLLHLLGGLDTPTSGSILFEGRDLGKLSSNALAEYRARKVGFVFQFHHLLPAFTALENVMIPALIQRVSVPEARRRSREALDRVGLSHRITHRPGQLSGGEQQRVAIARAIVMEPRLLLADEPTGNLDSGTGLAVHNLLLQLNSDLNMTMIVVTHNHDLAAMFSREVTMADGQIKEDKRRDEAAV